MNLRQRIKLRTTVVFIVGMIERLANLVLKCLGKQPTKETVKPRKILPWRNKDE